MLCYVIINPLSPFIHSFRPFLSSTTQRRSRLQHGYCIGVSRRSAQATAGKGLAQGPYMAASRTHDPPVESNRLNQCATMSKVVSSGLQSFFIPSLHCLFLLPYKFQLKVARHSC